MSKRKTLIEVKGLKVHHKAENNGDYVGVTYVWKTTENDKYVITHYVTQHTYKKDSFYEPQYPDRNGNKEREWYGRKGEVQQFTSQSKSQKFVCVGGPMAGEKIAFPPKNSYVLYNRNSDYGKYDKCPSAVWVYVAAVEGR